MHMSTPNNSILTTISIGHDTTVFIANNTVIPNRNAKCTSDTVTICNGTQELFTYILNVDNNPTFKYISYARIDDENICCFYLLSDKYYLNIININADNPMPMKIYNLNALCTKTDNGQGLGLESDIEHNLNKICAIDTNIYIYNEKLKNIYVFSTTNTSNTTNTSDNTINFNKIIVCENARFDCQLPISENKIIGTKILDNKQVIQIIDVSNHNTILSQYVVPLTTPFEKICYYKPNIIIGIFFNELYFIDIHKWEILVHLTDVVYNSRYVITDVKADGDNFNYYAGRCIYYCKSPFTDNVINVDNTKPIHLSILSIETRNEYLENENIQLLQRLNRIKALTSDFVEQYSEVFNG